MTYNKLNIIDEFLNKLHNKDIEYCHWKSNEHIEAALAGETDLDLLVDRNNAKEVTKILSNVGFILLEESFIVSYPSIQHYVGYDGETGKIAHIHLHYQLVLGQKRVKGFRLPIEDRILDTRYYDKQLGIYKIEANIEFILLILRYSLKIRIRDYVKAPLYGYFSDEFYREYDWLLEKIDEPLLLETVEEIFNPEANNVLRKIIKTQISFKKLVNFKRSINDELERYRTYSKTEAIIRGSVIEGYHLIRIISNRFNQPRVYRRRPSGGGITIALVGGDGSGKSTIQNELNDWLGWKLETQTIYFGSGDGKATWFRIPLIQVKNIYNIITDKSNKNYPESSPSSNDRIYRKIFRVLWALILSIEKRKKLKRCWRGRNRGLIILTDRYPQNQFMGTTDGPLLCDWENSKSKIKRSIAKFERTPYVWSEDNQPDLVFKLKIDKKTSMRRAGDHSEEEIMNRLNVINELKFPESEVVEIDAMESKDEVLNQIKRKIWKHI